MHISQKTSQFATDTTKGLTTENKFLHPKYFYDKEGSLIFQRIMRMPEYYLTGCEYEIFKNQAEQICRAITPSASFLEIIELGAGDGLKSKILLNTLTENDVAFKYVPIDISRHALSQLRDELKHQIPGIEINEMAGDFFSIMKSFNGHDQQRVVLFLGSNIGNFMDPELDRFLSMLSHMTMKGDKTLIGFDLKKSPEIITSAYDDPHGHTRDFNLNHLTRINRELEADFDINNFMHHTSYNPVNGSMKSFLISKKDQKVYLASVDQTIYFKKWEPIFMELSRKFDPDDIEKLATDHGFMVEKNFFDEKEYFTDSLWVRV
jgi:L-histidine Nalpha-methyltransferase